MHHALAKMFKQAAAKGITMLALAEAAEVHRTTLYRWRKGKHGPTLDELARLEKAVKEYRR